MYLVNHPDLIRELFVSNHQSVGRGRLTETLRHLLGDGLVAADGPFHLRQRRLMQPQFHRSRISDYGQTMVDFILEHEGRWQDEARVDMAQEMSELTRISVAQAAVRSPTPLQVNLSRGGPWPAGGNLLGNQRTIQN